MPSAELTRILDLLSRGMWNDPFRVLGPHLDADGPGGPGLVVRAIRPGVSRAEVVPLDGTGGREVSVEMTLVHPDGIFEAHLPGRTLALDYRLTFTWSDGHSIEVDDPYRFGQVLGEMDLHLLGEGTHYRSWERLGSHLTTIGHSTGTYFAVWAPNADRVSVVGDFNGWDGRVAPDAVAGRQRDLGAVHSRASAAGSITSTRSGRGRPACRS